jgi:hypothetical protein
MKAKLGGSMEADFVRQPKPLNWFGTVRVKEARLFAA